MANTNSQVDGYVRKVKQWEPVLQKLRQIALDSPLVEDVKWRAPCYTLDGRNIVLIGRFKEYCVIHFVKGSLLKDPKKILVKPGENSQVSRIVRFTNVEDVERMRPVLKAYVQEAIDVEKSGKKVTLKKIEEYPVPEELKQRFDSDAKLEKAFRSLTPGRQRMYLFHISSAKQSTTRVSRMEKCIPRILAGKGLDDD